MLYTNLLTQSNVLWSMSNVVSISYSSKALVFKSCDGEGFKSGPPPRNWLFDRRFSALDVGFEHFVWAALML